MIKKIGLTVLLATSLLFGSAITASAASVTKASPNVSYTTHIFQLGNGKWKQLNSHWLSNYLKQWNPSYEKDQKDKPVKETEKEKESEHAQPEQNNQVTPPSKEEKPKQEQEKDNNQTEQSTPDEQAEPEQAPAPEDTVVEPEESEQSNAAYQLSQFEQEVVELTNQERQKQGLAPFKIDRELSRVAREKSNDMNQKGYFSHTSPTYGSPFDMMKSYGITYRTAGENIARGQRTPQEVVTGWMNSPGHRANILNESFTHIGVGYVEQGNHWTQQFIGK